VHLPVPFELESVALRGYEILRLSSPFRPVNGANERSSRRPLEAIVLPGLRLDSRYPRRSSDAYARFSVANPRAIKVKQAEKNEPSEVQITLMPLARLADSPCGVFVRLPDLGCVVRLVAQSATGKQHFDQECDKRAHCEKQRQTKGHE
jgi:hypothetical protein